MVTVYSHQVNILNYFQNENFTFLQLLVYESLAYFFV